MTAEVVARRRAGMGKALGERVRRLRDEQGWSLSQLAAKAQITKGNLHKIETGKTANPRVDVIARIAKALKTDIGSFLGDMGVQVRSPDKPMTLAEYRRLEELVSPVEVPLYVPPDYDKIVRYVYVPRISEMLSGELMSFLVGESDFTPTVSMGDVIVVAWDVPPKEGQRIACLRDDHKLLLGRCSQVGGHRYIVNNAGQTDVTDEPKCGTITLRITPFVPIIDQLSP